MSFGGSVSAMLSAYNNNRRARKTRANKNYTAWNTDLKRTTNKTLTAEERKAIRLRMKQLQTVESRKRIILLLAGLTLTAALVSVLFFV